MRLFIVFADMKIVHKRNLKNFGTISVNSMKDLNTTSILYNAPKATINVTGKSVASWEQSVFTKGAIYNFGELTIQEGALKFNSQDAIFIMELKQQLILQLSL